MVLEAITAGFRCTMYVLLFVAGAQAGLLLFEAIRKKTGNLLQSNETAGLIFGAISLLYSLLLAFVIVAVWTDYEELNDTIEKEADKLNNILSHSSTLPDTLKQPMFNAISGYCNLVVTKEWQMRQDEDRIRPSAIPSLRILLLRTEPVNKLQDGIFSVIDDDLSDVSDFRRERLDHTRSHVPGIVWLILKAGSIVMIVFSYFLDVPSIRLKRVYLFFLSSMMAMSLFLVDVLDHPFTGSVAVSKRPYENILHELTEQLISPSKKIN